MSSAGNIKTGERGVTRCRQIRDLRDGFSSDISSSADVVAAAFNNASVSYYQRGS